MLCFLPVRCIARGGLGVLKRFVNGSEGGGPQAWNAIIDIDIKSIGDHHLGHVPGGTYSVHLFIIIVLRYANFYQFKNGGSAFQLVGT